MQVMSNGRDRTLQEIPCLKGHFPNTSLQSLQDPTPVTSWSRKRVCGFNHMKAALILTIILGLWSRVVPPKSHSHAGVRTGEDSSLSHDQLKLFRSPSR